MGLGPERIGCQDNPVMLVANKDGRTLSDSVDGWTNCSFCVDGFGVLAL